MIDDDDDNERQPKRGASPRDDDKDRAQRPAPVSGRTVEEVWSDIDRDRDLFPDAERDRPGRAPSMPRDPQSIPDEITKRYYCRTDRGGDQHVYADSKGARELFQASEKRLRTKTDDPQCVKMMLDTAAHRGWSSITARGSDEFRRETWLEGQARGIEVRGYKPNELDLQELKKREQVHLRNEIAPVLEREADSPSAPGDPARSDGPTPPERERQANYREGVEGVLVEHGTRPYRDGPGADPSPYATLRDAQGRQHTAWGVGIPNALMQAGAREGDRVRLRETGMEQVTKSVIREVDGHLKRVDQLVNRRAWEAEVSRSREDLEREGQKILNERDAPEGDDREQRIQTTAAKANHMVDSRDQALHVGPGRDAAVSEGMLANEARAKEYQAQGRMAALTNPELRGAATMEAYIERKVRAKLGADPVAVDRVMAMARERIVHAVASGYDFPKVRVVETRERSPNDLERGADRGPEARPDPEQVQDRDRDREEDRELDRQRDRDRGRER